jgi:hypothetical protein
VFPRFEYKNEVLTVNIGIPDATQISSRFAASAVMCRLVAAYELASMRAAQSNIDASSNRGVTEVADVEGPAIEQACLRHPQTRG